MKSVKLIFLLVVNLFLFSCNKEDSMQPVLSKRVYEMHAGDKSPIDGSHLDMLEWDSQDLYIATVSDNNMIIANFVGGTFIHSNKFSIIVDVLPKYNDYTLPIMFPLQRLGGIEKYIYRPEYTRPYYGFSKGLIRAIVEDEGYKYNKSYSNNQLLVFDTGNINSPYLVYFFENDGLRGAGTLIPTTKSGNLVDFIAERYFVINKDGNSISFGHGHSENGEPVLDLMGSLGYSSSIGGYLMYFEYHREQKFISCNSLIVDNHLNSILKQ